MTKQFDQVQTGLITFAARDSEYDGHSIKKGEILALDNGKLDFTDRDITKALTRLVRHLVKKKDASFITLIYGSDVTDDQAEQASGNCGKIRRRLRGDNGKRRTAGLLLHDLGGIKRILTKNRAHGSVRGFWQTAVS